LTVEESATATWSAFALFLAALVDVLQA